MTDESSFQTMLNGTIAPIYVELLGRLDAELSEKDQLAVLTAFAKVAFGSARVAAAEAAAQLSEQDVLDLLPRFEFAETDRWAEQYGGDA